jgi:hypothetical protein
VGDGGRRPRLAEHVGDLLSNGHLLLF